MSILDAIVARKTNEADALRGQAARLERAAADAAPARDFAGALRRAQVAVIAEFKRRSPSAGWIRERASVEDVTTAYQRAGAAALSILTDRDGFGGSLEDLRVARRATSLPILRKDFTIDVLQVIEARAAGADAVLLIARILTDARLRELHEVARELHMSVLVEVHDALELDRALTAGAELIGVNNRDLATFHTDLQVTENLAAHVPQGCVLVAESGIRGAEDVDRLGQTGVDAVLVGESLMRAPDAVQATAELVGRPRASRKASRI
jgi:indole-3-glycerol phosphate synthase